MTPACQHCAFWDTWKPPGRGVETEYQRFRPCRQVHPPGFTGRSTLLGRRVLTAPDVHCRAFLSLTLPPAPEAS